MLSSHTKDLTGIRFGSLVAICPDHKGQNGSLYWRFQCDCGNTHIARGNVVNYEAKKNDPKLPSCGCVELSRKTKHGFRKVNNTHRAYAAYVSMMGRCYTPSHIEYKHYGAIGTTVCDEWKNNPEAFVQWSVDNGWKKGLVVDKDILCDQLNIHPEIYSPQTCQWIEPKENTSYSTSRHRFGRNRNIKLSEGDVQKIIDLYVSGEVTNKSELARMFGVLSPSTIDRILPKKISCN